MPPLQATVDAEALLRRAAALLEAGRTGAAGPLLAAARRLAPADTRIAQLAGRIALQDGRLTLAATELDAAVRLAPQDAQARMLRADLRRSTGDLDGATRDAAEAVLLDRHDPTAKALLGALLLELGRATEAVACLREAVAGRPGDPAFREALATAETAAGDPAAADTLRDGIAANPTSVALRNAAILHAIRSRDFASAEQQGEAARVLGIVDACTFGLRGHALSSLGRHQEAAEAYAEAHKLAPDDPYVRHLAAWPASSRAATGPRKHICRQSSMVTPSGSMLISSRSGIACPAWSAGRCWTILSSPMAARPVRRSTSDAAPELVALALSDLPIGPFTGVDLSPRMLEQAAVKSLYAELRQADITTMLTDATERWPLILAADVLCYFGALEQLLPAIHDRLQPGGWFVFTLEELLPGPDGTVAGNGRWALQRQGRYVHRREYVTSIAAEAGFRILRVTPEVLRQEADAPVAGLLAVLERPA